MVMINGILPFAPNRVLRLYLGGSGIDKLCGKTECEDNRYPENWIASCIEGNGRAYHSPGHGISKIIVDGELRDFPAFLNENAEMMLGKKHLQKYGVTPAVLVKLLDSAEQLPLQIHPTREDAKKYLNSDYGKTEAWIVLATREVAGEKPYLLVGFNKELDSDVFSKESLAGKYEQGSRMLNRIEVAAGDVILIRGGMPHAIGPGVTMVEVMEPSDWVIIPEIECCGVALNEKQRFMGIAPETALKMFDFTAMTPEQVRKYCTPQARTVEERSNGILKAVIPPEECALFSAEELTIKSGTWQLENSDGFAVGIVVEGSLKINNVQQSAGDNFFLPWAVKELEITGQGRLMLIRPPRS